MAATLGIALTNMGGPADLAGIEPFLFNLLADPAMLGMPGWIRRPLAGLIARRRAPRVVERYRLIGGGSPVVRGSEQQAAAVEQALGGRALVRAVMRYTEPRAEVVLDAMRKAGVRRLIALPAYPQYSCTTTGSSVDELRVAAAARGLELQAGEAYATAPGYIDALAAGAVPWVNPGCHVLMTAHGLPERVIRAGDPYRDQVQQTAEALALRLPEGTPWSLAFQSRLGPVKWLTPYVEDEVARLAAQGCQALLTVPLTFAVENLETLYDLDRVAAEQAGRLGIAWYHRAPAPGCHPRFIEALAEVARSAAGRAGWSDLSSSASAASRPGAAASEEISHAG
ncbi:MAG: ferrochelatase [Pseudomonadota bacterium]